MYKENIKFHDSDNYICNIDIIIDNGKFSMSGEYNGSMGQCLDHIKPKNKYQKELIELWEQYHLNNLNAGTKLQRKVLGNYKGDYNESSKYLKEHDIKGNELSISDYKKFNSAYELYNEKVKGFNILKENLIRQYKESKESNIYNISIFEIKLDNFEMIEEKIKLEFINKLETKLNSGNSIKNLSNKNIIYMIPDSIYTQDIFINRLKDIKVDIPEEIFLSAYVVKEIINHKEVMYTYGYGWIHDPLPKQIEDTVSKLVTKIKEIEDKEYCTAITKESYEYSDTIKEKIEELSYDLHTTEVKLLAICIECGVTLEALEDDIIEVDGNRFTVEGQEWLVCNDEEANDEHLEYVESLIDDIGFDGLNLTSGPICKLIDGKIEVSQSVIFGTGERGNSLSSYDGEERYNTVLNETIYMYRN